jgi:3,4-dihydroxy 2-butanone 4-phosphate synthase/GTP cyclohydrolase II
MISIEDMIEYRRRTEVHIEHMVSTELPTRHGQFTAHGYRSLIDDKQHMALVQGDVKGSDEVLVRIHSECCTGDVFGSLRCDCGEQLDAALQAIDTAGTGVLLYLAQEGRGIGLLNKLRAYELQQTGLDTVEANEALGYGPDLREYDLAAQILRDLGVERVRMLTNNPSKIDAIERYGLEVTERVQIEIEPGDDNRSYLITKRDKLGHLLSSSALNGNGNGNGAHRETVTAGTRG